MTSDNETDTSSSAIVLDEHDAAAVSALLIRTIRVEDELKRDRDAVTEANARITANVVARSKTITAFGVFGFDTGEPLWSQVAQSLGGDGYKRAFAIARGYELAKLPEQTDKPGAHYTTNISSSEPIGSSDAENRNHAPRIKDAIWEHVQAAGDAGVTARAVRQQLEDVHNLIVHEKTPGMTLYRLLKEGLVTRNGRVWRAKKIIRENEIEAPKDAPKSGEAQSASTTAPHAQDGRPQE